MFQKILVANRGEIAVRIIRTCRDLGIATVALYSSTERDSLHVRLADECMPVFSDLRYGDPDEVLAIAQQTGADALHPGYGFLAENPDFATACGQAGITFIGPPPEVIARLQDKVATLARVREAGFDVPPHSAASVSATEVDRLREMAEALGYPLVIKACRGGRGRGSRVVDSPARLMEALQRVHYEAQRIYGSEEVYLEKAIAPSHYVAVQILADDQGAMIHLGEREGSLLLHNQKLVEESPAPCLSPAQRTQLWAAAVEIAHLFDYRNAGTVEFLVDGRGVPHFTEIKARIQIEHPVSEMVSGVDIVREQIRLAAGYPLSQSQAEIRLHGCAIQCRINAEDPWHNYLPSPGRLERFRLPGGNNVRVDTYGYVGCNIPVRYDSLLANLIVWADDRPAALQRMRRALEDFKIMGVQTNLAMHQQIVREPHFEEGVYDTNFMRRFQLAAPVTDPIMRRDLAIAAAVAYQRRGQGAQPALPDRLLSGWHRSSRRLPS